MKNTASTRLGFSHAPETKNMAAALLFLEHRVRIRLAEAHGSKLMVIEE